MLICHLWREPIPATVLHSIISLLFSSLVGRLQSTAAYDDANALGSLGSDP